MSACLFKHRSISVLNVSASPLFLLCEYTIAPDFSAIFFVLSAEPSSTTSISYLCLVLFITSFIEFITLPIVFSSLYAGIVIITFIVLDYLFCINIFRFLFFLPMASLDFLLILCSLLLCCLYCLLSLCCLSKVLLTV